jgi:hypothetical protein
MGNLGDK